MGLAERVYERLPIPLQNLAISYMGWRFEYKRSHPELIAENLKNLLESQWWSEEEFQKYQTAKLQETLRHAFATVPHYREMRERLQCNAEDFTSPSDISRLPLLSKQELRGNEESFVSEEANLTQCVQTSTSGSTGTPLKCWESTESASRRFAFVARLRTWAGVPKPVRAHRAQFTGRSIIPDRQDPNKPPFWRNNKPNDARLFSTTHISEKTVPHYVRGLREFAPDLIDGYPSAILMIARIAKQQKLELPKPKAIIVSAETLFPEHRAEIKEAFGCLVYDQYASSEPSCFWCDNEHGEMLISPEYGISEIIKPDGSPAGPGEEGEVVVTSFLNPVMPLIRYRVGDMAVMGEPGPAKCGRNMQRIQSVSGRKDDILYIPERGYIGRLDPVFKGLSNIIEAQIIQESLEQITILLVPAPGYESKHGQKLVDNLRSKVGQAVAIDLRVVEQIPRGANGKFRTVISRCRDQYPTQV